MPPGVAGSSAELLGDFGFSASGSGIPHSLVAEGATHHFQVTASSSPGSVLEGGLHGLTTDWENKLPHSNQKTPINDSGRTRDKRMTVDIHHPAHGAKRKQATRS